MKQSLINVEATSCHHVALTLIQHCFNVCVYGVLLFFFISYLSYKLHCCTLPDKHCLSHGMCFNQVMMTLHFLNDVAYEAKSTQKSKITS